MQVKRDYICQKHGQIIKMVVLDQGVPKEDLLHCSKCLDLNRQPYRMIGVDQAIEMIKEKLNIQKLEKEETLNEPLTMLQKCQSNLVGLRSSLINSIDEILRFVQQWITDLNKEKRNCEFSDLIQGLEILYSTSKQEHEKKNQETYQIKIDAVFKRLQQQDGIQKCRNEFLKLTQKNKQKTKIQEQTSINLLDQAFYNSSIEDSILEKSIKIIQMTPSRLHDRDIQAKKIAQAQSGIKQKISLQLISQFYEQYDCYSIAFNNDSSIMITAQSQLIKIYNFNDGEIRQLAVVEIKGFSCLIFSKRKQFFLYGDQEGYIYLCNQDKKTNQQINNFIPKLHASEITCLLMNKNETQLFSSTCQSKIFVWKINSETNQLHCSYNLDNENNLSVKGMTLNDAETLLISYSYNQLTLWVQSSDGKWCFQRNLKVQSGLQKVWFIGDNDLLIKLFSIQCINLFKIQDQQLIQLKDFKLKLPIQDIIEDNKILMIYNRPHKIIVLKYFKFVSIFQKHDNCCYQVQQIDFETEFINFSMTEDCRHLIIWDGKTRQIRIYKISHV